MFATYCRVDYVYRKDVVKIKSQKKPIEDGISKIGARSKSDFIQQDTSLQKEPKERVYSERSLQETRIFLSYHISGFFEFTENRRIELAINDLKKDLKQFYQNFSSYKIDKEIFAKALAKDAPEHLDEFLKYAQFSETQLINLIPIIALYNSRCLFDFFKNNCANPSMQLMALQEIGKAIDYAFICSHISHFGVTDMDVLTKIAINAAKNAGAHASLAMNFEKFCLTREAMKEHEEDFIRIAEIIVEHQPKKFIEFIKKFQLNEATHIRIFENVGQNQGWDLICKNMQHFGLTDEKIRIQIAKIIAKEDPDAIVQNIDVFDISNKKELAAIAEIALQAIYDLESTIGAIFAKNFHKFFKKEQDLIKFIKIAINKNAKNAESIKDFCIKNEQVRLELACYAIQHGYQGIFKDIESLNLTADNRCILFSQAIFYFPEMSKSISIFFPSSKDPCYPEFLWLQSKPPSDVAIHGLLENLKQQAIDVEILKKIENQHIASQHITERTQRDAHLRSIVFYCAVLDFAKDSKLLLNRLIMVLDQLEKTKDSQAIERQMKWMALLMLQCRAHHISAAELHNQWPFFVDLQNLKDPLLRWVLTNHFIHALKNPDLFKTCMIEFSTISILLSSIVDSITPDTGVIVEKGEPLFNLIPFSQKIKTLLSTSKFFKDQIKVNSLLRSLNVLMETPLLNRTDKRAILRNLIFVQRVHEKPLTQKGSQKKQETDQEWILKSAQAVAQFIELGMIDPLKSITDPKYLDSMIEEMFHTALGISVEDFTTKYRNTIGKWRKPQALLTYATRLKTLPIVEQEMLMPHLKRFVEDVLNSKFPQSRYAEDSEFMRKLRKYPKLLQAWKEDFSFAHSCYTISVTDNPNDLMLSGSAVGSCQKYDGDPAYNKGLLAYLLDPKVRMISIKNSSGDIIARCMMRLLWNEDTKKFVLFQEIIYPISYVNSALLNEACKEFAKHLGVQHAKASEIATDTSLTALPSIIPFEFVDALGGIVEADKGYIIPSCTFV